MEEGENQLAVTQPNKSPHLIRSSFTWMNYLLPAYYSYLQAILGPLMPFLSDELHISYSLAGAHFSSFSFGILLSGILGDRFIVRFGRRCMIWVGGAGMAIASIMFISIPFVSSTIFWCLVMGFLGSFCLTIGTSGLSLQHSRHRPTVLSEQLVSCCLAASISPVLLGFCEVYVPFVRWKGAIILPVFFFIICAATFGRISWAHLAPPGGYPRMQHAPHIEPPGADESVVMLIFKNGQVVSKPDCDAPISASASEVKEPAAFVDTEDVAFLAAGGAVITETQPQETSGRGPNLRLPRSYWAYAAIICLSVAHEWILIYWGSMHIKSDLHLSSVASATNMNLFLLSMTIGRIIGSRLGLRFDASAVLIASLLLNLVAYIPFWLCSSPVVALSAFFLAGLGMANQYPFTLSLALASSPRELSDLASSRIVFAGGTSILIGTQALGFLADRLAMMHAMALPVFFLVPCILVAATLHLRMATQRGHNLQQQYPES